MPSTAILFGGLLILLGLAGYGVGLLGEYASWTSLIPAFPGVPILLCGLIGLQGGSARKHAMHVAAVFALLGALATFGGFKRAINPETFNIISTIAVTGMLLLCGGFLVLCIKSFIAARKARQAETATAPAS
ncbi:MAG: hypothetical protein AAGK78_05585 [Planctomycetota bacterium]